MRLAGKVALVTGGGKGIGKGLALALGAEGADVALTYHASAVGAREVVATLEQSGRRAQAIPANLAKVADARRAVQATVESLGGLDLLVYNAGVTEPRPFLEMTEEHYDATLDLNLKGAYFCAQEAARVMIARGVRGSIVLISSLHGFLSFPGHTHYAASKAGMDQFVRTAANELGPYGIRINAVAPGMIEVEKYPEVFTNYDRNEWGPTIPLGRVGEPLDIARVVNFLASDEADYITGITIRVDGGIMTRSPHYPPSPITTYPDRRPKWPGASATPDGGEGPPEP